MKSAAGKNTRENLSTIAGIEAIYDHYAARFLGLCYRYCGNREDAEDIMHDGFMHIIRNAHQFHSRGEGSLEAWMKRIMVTTSLKFLRNHEKYKRFMVIEPVIEEGNIPEDEDDADNPIPDLSQEQLLKLITELPLGYRTVFNFYVMEDYSHKEIAELMNCSENTSKTQLMKARAWLRKRINDLEKNTAYGLKEKSS